MSKRKSNNKWVVYPEPIFTLEELMLQKHMSGKTNQNENEIDVKSVKTPEEINAMLPKDVELLEDDVTVEGKLMEGVEEEFQKELTEEEKKAIFIQQLKDSRIRFHKYTHPTVSVVVSETIKDFGGGYKRKVQERTVVPITNETVTKFGAEYRKKRQRKNKMARASRKANR